ncbi:MAG: citryl-CoA lyase [Rhizobiales bacterium]|nr:citryl-CoA lyase [Hyphomicrobiales bacterium]NRB13123.1 citryl-CoA lyase [Hyphomicrobiales bacterium]
MTQDQNVANWWRTDIIEMKPGEIRYRGYEVQDLIGQISFSQMIWLMLRGELPTKQQANLLDIALMSAVDHGPQAPSIAIARMAATCGVGLNNAMASAMNVLGDVHGGAGEQAIEIYTNIAQRMQQGASLNESVAAEITHYNQHHGKFLPGFGHRFHPIDPRAKPLLDQVYKAAKIGVVSGKYADIAIQVEAELGQRKGKKIPMNIDGATAVIYAELGFAAPLARGLFCLSRSVGILAHAWEQTQQDERNKGPMPKNYLWSYTGEQKRPLPTDKDDS